MNKPPAALTFSASAEQTLLCASMRLRNISLAFKISSSSVSAKPVASAMTSSVKPALRRSVFARYSALPPSMMSVPRPAMLVAMVTAPSLPACATISASFSWCFAFSTLCAMPLRFRSPDRYSLFSMEMVPTRTG